MITKSVHTLVNPQNGELAFKVFSFEDATQFDHVQRLNYLSMILITEGEATLKADFTDYQVEKNTLLCFAPYQPFMLAEAKGVKGVVINFHPDFFCIHKHHKEVSCSGILFGNIYEPPYVTLNNDELNSLLALVEQMKTEVQNSDLAQYDLLISYLKIFLINATRIKVAQRPEVISNPDEGSEPYIIQSLKDAIEQHYRTRHSAGDYADLLNISANALAKVVKSYFNKTLTGLIAERIIIEAKRELYLTSKAVKQIAYELGFNDEYYFSRFFKNNANVSPQLYRDTVGFAKGEEY
ncbi:helix-turn-helix domain-containing protein [Fulvivirga kasyanovii]|uniref:Helix-turn-helix domain-containing protein n=1 Tax=Fulvivirga kasyanovii TaxID=396812 RepID=A0ABW9RXN3_9BACT|nr:helix-turn-helix domain-containing protein [Fulvivirga kasyanovii]MTI27963.1 helix-turn-helix domain-containing protein [Fulvivirga kasyanovii]